MNFLTHVSRATDEFAHVSAVATTVFGTPRDITLAELALETFLPADAHTGEVLRSLAAGRSEAGG